MNKKQKVSFLIARSTPFQRQVQNGTEGLGVGIRGEGWGVRVVASMIFDSLL